MLISNRTTSNGPINEEAKGTRLDDVGFRWLLWSLLFLHVFEPASYVFSNYVNQIFTYLGYFSVAATVVLFFMYRYRFDAWLFLLCLGFVLSAVSTVFMDSMGALKSHVTESVEVIAFILLLDIGLKNDRRACLRGFYVVAAITILVCAYTMFAYKKSGGMRHNAGTLLLDWGRRQSRNWYYLGHDTGSIFYIYPALVIMLVHDYLYKGGVTVLTAACYVATLASCIYVASTSATILLIVSSMVFLVLENFRMNWLTFGSCIVFWVVANIGVVHLRWYSRFQDFIVTVLHKSADLTGREYIWERALLQINNHPYFGSGTLNNATLGMVLGINHCHNLLLEYLFRGGVVGLVVFLLAFTLSGRKVKALSVGPIKNLIIAAIFGYTILCLFDGYYFNPVPYALFCLANNLVDLQSEYENNGVEA